MTAKSKLVGAMVVTLLTWASAFLAVRAGVKNINPDILALWRFAIASAAFGLLTFWFPVRRPRRQEAGYLLLTGFLGVTAYHFCFNRGAVHADAGSMSLLINSSPIFGGLLGTFFLKERLGWMGWIGIILGFVGVALISFSGEGERRLGIEALWIVGSAFFVSIYSLLIKSKLGRFSSFEIGAYNIWIGTLFLSFALPDLLREWKTFDSHQHLLVLYLGLIPGVVSFITWAYVIQNMPYSKAMPFTYLLPVITMSMAWFFMNEFPTSIGIMGGTLTLIGVILVQAYRAPSRRPKKIPVSKS